MKYLILTVMLLLSGCGNHNKIPTCQNSISEVKDNAQTTTDSNIVVRCVKL